MDRAHGCGESSTRQRRPLYVTGSSSKMLSAEIPSGFRGRALELGLLPFSFAESCLRGGEVIGESGLVGVPAAVRARMERHLDSYLEQGGPAACGLSRQQAILLLQSHWSCGEGVRRCVKGHIVFSYERPWA